MLTLFTTAKPFRGHFAIIQRNALRSWTLLHPGVEVIVFGDDDGSAEVCAELGLQHEPEVARTRGGAIRLDDMFRQAQALARHDLLCYANCDIILQSDFCSALQEVSEAHGEFLMVGRRWDANIMQLIDFLNPGWQEQTRRLAVKANKQRDEWWIDYFAFTRGLYGTEVPALAVGRTSWDNWLMWKILAQEKPVIDASRAIVAIHQNHDYNHHPQGYKGVWRGEDFRKNVELTGGWRNLRTIADATELLTSKGLKPNPHRHWSGFKRGARSLGRFIHYNVWNPVWFTALDATRSLRTVLGLRSEAMRRRGKI